jgi:PAS domain S-box-containing protein
MSHENILIVEDEGIVAMDIQNRLRSMGHNIVGITPNGEDAVTRAGEVRPDLVLMDIMLQGNMDGIAAAEKIRRKYDIPIVFLTAYSENATLNRAKDTAPFGYVLKPFTSKELYIAVEMALHKHDLEKKLRYNEERFRVTLKSIGDAVITTDMEGRVTFMNHVAETLTGWSSKSAEGKGLEVVFKVIDEESREPLAPLLAGATTHGDIQELINMCLASKDGVEIPLEGDSASIIDDTGAKSGSVLVFRDLTERRARNEELLKLKKLNSLGVLAGGMAHDFNNILTGIMGNVELINDFIGDTERTEKRITQINKLCTRAKRLTQQLITFSSGGAPIKEVVRVKDLVDDAAAMVLRGSLIKYNEDNPGKIAAIEADKEQMSQALVNIFTNASEAMEKTGTIDILTEELHLCDKAVADLKEGSYIRITIEDTGCGIMKDNITRVFDPFFTTKKQGSGLGLSAAYSIIKRHDGHITISSEPGQGTTFSLYLPATDSHPDSDYPDHYDKCEAIKTQKGEGKILVMDDDYHIRTMLSFMLPFLGYETTCTASGEEAIESYKEAFSTKKPFDLVIMDLSIENGMGGEEMIKKLIALDPKAKAVVASGYYDTPIMTSFRDYGFSAAMQKPYNKATLSSTLFELLKKNSLK